MIKYYKISGLITLSTYLSKLTRDMFIPILPLLSTYYTINYNQAQNIIAVYFLGIALARIIWPYFADKICKKKIMLTLYCCFILSTIGGLTTNSFNTLLLCRFSQAFFLSSIPLIIRAIVHDQLGTTKSIKIYSYISILTSWAPAISISLAAYYATNYSFNSLLLFVVFFACINFLYIYLFFTKHNLTNNAEKPSGYFNTLYQILLKKNFWIITLPLTMLMAGNGIYQATAAYLLTKSFKLTLIQVSLSFFLITGCRLGGKLITGFLIDLISKKKLSLFATIICFFSSFISLCDYYYNGSSYQLIYGIMIYYLGIGMINPITKGNINAQFPKFKTTSLGCLMSVTNLGIFFAITCASIFTLPTWEVLFSALTLLSFFACSVSILQNTYFQKTSEIT